MPETAAPDAAALIEWIEAVLRVPTGPLMGRPFKLGDWQKEWIAAALAPGIQEAGQSVARKNGKSGEIAAVILAGLCGPLNRHGWRAIVTSMTGLLAKELRHAIVLTARASGLEDRIRERKAPPPGFILGDHDSRVDFLAADRATGHAVGADLALIDEAGLLQEAQRGLWNAVYSCISGRNGRFWAISIQGDGPMFQELEARAATDTVHWQKFAADTDGDIFSEEQWHKANPGLTDGIKSIEYMRGAASRAKTATANEMHFRAYDLNMPVDPERETIVSVHDYQGCVADRPEPLSGDIIIGWDLGGSASMTCAAAYSLESRRLKVFGAFGDEPPLSQRARTDRMGSLYQRMVDQGELTLYPGKVTPVVDFMSAVMRDVADCGTIIAMGTDRYRRAEAQQAFADAGIPNHVPVHWRGQGASKTADGTHDVRAFQKSVLGKRLCVGKSAMLEAAIASSVLRYDNAGNPALDKAGNNARIDALSAAVIAVGIGDLIQPKPLFKHHVV